MSKKRKTIALALGSIGLVFAAVTIAGLAGVGRDDGPANGSVEAAKASGPEIGDAGASVAELPAEAVAAPAVDVVSSLPAFGPKVIQTASLRLVVARGDFDEVVARARSIAVGLGGFVASSSATQGDDGRLVRGALVVRLPGDRYGDAMNRLSRLGRIEGRDESGQDVSAQFVDLQARSRHLEAVERRLLELLDRAGTVPAALEVQSQLNAVQLELEQLRGRLRYLDDQVAYATISLELREKPVPGTGGTGDDGWGIVEAWRDAARGFVQVASGIIVAVATAAPVLLVLALGLLGVRLAVRARRRSGAPA
jgi:hypothetical protein